MIRVGTTKEPKNYYKYTDVKFDPDGWANADEFLPELYDLCQLKIEGESSKPGWFCGFGWDGAGVKEADKVLFWKRLEV